MKKAFVTGATGCVGRNLVDELLEDKWEVTVLHRRSSDLSKLAGCDVNFVEVDLHDVDSVRHALNDEVDALFHAAANVSHWSVNADEQWQDNVIGTRNLVAAALETKVKRFIYTSTAATDLARKPTRIHSGYIHSKKQADIEVCQGIEAGLDAVILQLGIVIGKYDYNNYSKIFRLLQQGRLRFSLPGIMVFSHARDVARGHILAYDEAPRGARYYFGGEQTSWHDIFVRMSRLLKIKPPFKPPPVWLISFVAYVMTSISYMTKKEPMLTPEAVFLLNCDKKDIDGFIQGEKEAASLGYRSASIDEALRDCHSWLQDQAQAYCLANVKD